MKNKFIPCLLIFVLIMTGAVQAVVFASGQETEAGLPAETDPAKGIEEDLEELLQDTDTQTLSEYAEMVWKVISSESFQSLVSYPEMQAFAKEAIRAGTEFALSDLDLTRKILITAGLDETSADITVKLLKAVDSDKELIQTFVQSLVRPETAVGNG